MPVDRVTGKVAKRRDNRGRERSQCEPHGLCADPSMVGTVSGATRNGIVIQANEAAGTQPEATNRGMISCLGFLIAPLEDHSRMFRRQDPQRLLHERAFTSIDIPGGINGLAYGTNPEDEVVGFTLT